MSALTCGNTPDEWVDGVAEVVRLVGPEVFVQCPHCGGEHRHERRAMGSRAVLAGCHRGPGCCRTYEIPRDRKRPW